MSVHVMLDLESWGTAPGSALRAIGACVFSPYCQAVDPRLKFYRNIARASCEQRGLTVDPQTEEWWHQQSAEAKHALELDQVPLILVIEAFHRWFEAVDGTYIWSHGAGFDVVLWECAARACNITAPWKYWNVRDTRTAFHLARINPKAVERTSTAHHALDDARHQAACVTLAYAKLGIPPAGAAFVNATTQVSTPAQLKGAP
jgi:hypothetical protein